MLRAELPLPSVAQAIGTESLDELDLDQHFAAIDAYIAPRIDVASEGQEMPIAVASLSITPTPLGDFLVVSFQAHEFDAVVETVRVGYRLFFDTDSEHRGVLVVQDTVTYARFAETGTVVSIFTPDRREQTVQIVTPEKIEYGRSAEHGALVRLSGLLAPTLAGSALLAAFVTWLLVKSRARRSGASGARNESASPSAHSFLAVFGATLLIAGASLLVAGVMPLRGEHWVPLQVRFDQREPRNEEAEFRAAVDGVYEIEVLELAPDTEDERGAVVRNRKRHGYPGVDWSVHNPHGRVAAGNGARVSYVTTNRVGPSFRVIQTLMPSSLFPDAKPSLSRQTLRQEWVVTGIGQWRARAAQTYGLSVARSSDVAAPTEPIGVRFRLRRQSWNTLFRPQETLLRGGFLASLLGVTLVAAGYLLRKRQTAAAP